jgi:hypothetical protein
MGMNAPAAVVHWGLLLITIPNLIVFSAIALLFTAALLLPFPHERTPMHEERRNEKQSSGV